MKHLPILTDKGIIKWRRDNNEVVFIRRTEGGVIPPKRRSGVVTVCVEVLRQSVELDKNQAKDQEPKEFWVLESIACQDIIDLQNGMIRLKDTWLCDIFWLPRGEIAIKDALQDTDGLTYYDDFWGGKKVNFFDRVRKWPSYRSKQQAASVYVTEEKNDFLITNLTAAKERGELKIVEENNAVLFGKAGPEPIFAAALAIGMMVKNPMKDWGMEAVEEDEKEERRH